MLITLIAITWISYPIVGLVGVRARSAQGDLTPPASFSYLPELAIYPPAFYGFAKIIDFFLRGWGSIIVGGVCLYMLAWFLIVFVRDLNTIKKFRNVE